MYRKLNSYHLLSFSTKEYFYRALNTGLNVMIADKNNIIEVDGNFNKKIVGKLPHPDYKLNNIISILENKFSNVIVCIKS